MALVIIIFILIALPNIFWQSRQLYQRRPERRMKWHQLTASAGVQAQWPKQIQPINYPTTTDASKWDTVEVDGPTLIIKDSSGVILRDLDIRTIYSVQSVSPGVVIIEPVKEGITLAGGNALKFDFRLSLGSQSAWNMGGLIQALPPKWLASSNSRLVKADREALVFYCAIQNARQT